MGTGPGTVTITGEEGKPIVVSSLTTSRTFYVLFIESVLTAFGESIVSENLRAHGGHYCHRFHFTGVFVLCSSRQKMSWGETSIFAPDNRTWHVQLFCLHVLLLHRNENTNDK